MTTVANFTKCNHCQTSIVGDFKTCPSCGKIINLKVESLLDLTNREDISCYTKNLIKHFDNIHISLCFTARYLAFHYHLQLFLNDVINGVMPNNRISDEDKYDYMVDFLLFVKEEGEKFDTVLIFPEFLDIEKTPINFIGINKLNKDMSEKKKKPEFHYHFLDADKEFLNELLTDLAIWHQPWQKLAQEFSSEKEGDTSLSPKEKISYIVEALKKIQETYLV